MTKVIAEIGCNHRGSLETAISMVNIAKNFSNVDIVKFQKRNIKELLSNDEYHTPHPNPINAYGKTYGEHREYLELTIDDHFEIKKYAESLGVEYSCSVWDIISTEEIISLNPNIIKIPSACNLNKNIWKTLFKKYNGEIHFSLGMTTESEECEIYDFIAKDNKNNKIVPYLCTSGYPINFEDVCLLNINNIRKKWGNISDNIVGFSGHHLGIAVDIAAVTLGASYVERHFTLDRTWKGTDHAASLEPDGMRRLTRDIAAVKKALSYKDKDILDIEIDQRKKLKRY